MTGTAPTWVLGVHGVIDRFYGGDMRETGQVADLSDYGVRPGPGVPAWSPTVVGLISTAVRRGVDVRWMTRSYDVDRVLAMTCVIDELPEIPVLTERDMPADYTPPRPGIVPIEVGHSWEVDGVAKIIPVDGPLLWTPSIDCVRGVDVACGTGGSRTIDEGVRWRTGPTTVIRARYTDRIYYLTDGDVEVIARWVDTYGLSAG